MSDAHTRQDDPETSRQAAEAVSPHLTAIQSKVAAYARRKGIAGFTDAEMADELEDCSSTFRTRRAELTDRMIIIDSGQRRTYGASPRERIVWLHRDFVQDAPDVILNPQPPINDSDKARARVLGPSLIEIADMLRRHKYETIANKIEEAGQLLERFGR